LPQLKRNYTKKSLKTPGRLSRKLWGDEVEKAIEISKPNSPK